MNTYDFVNGKIWLGSNIFFKSKYLIKAESELDS